VIEDFIRYQSVFKRRHSCLETIQTR